MESLSKYSFLSCCLGMMLQLWNSMCAYHSMCAIEWHTAIYLSICQGIGIWSLPSLHQLQEPCCFEWFCPCLLVYIARTFLGHVHSGRIATSKDVYDSGCAGGGLVAKSFLTLVTPWTVAYQAPLSMGCPRSGLPVPPPGDLADPGIEPYLWHCR